MKERLSDITALRAIGLLHKTQINLKTYASRCAICKTPVPCDTQRLVLDALGEIANARNT